MNADLLVLDIGNTSIKAGLADSSGLLCAYALPSRNEETSDSLGLSLLALLRHAQTPAEGLKACVIASVVPPLDVLFDRAIRRYLGFAPLFAGRDLPIPLDNHYSRPREVGMDILVGAYEARRLFPDAPALIVADFGTAATFACVSKNAYLGGLIFPGPETSLRALSQKAAKLPPINLFAPQATRLEPGRDTVASIRQGMLFGYAAMTDGLCAKLADHLAQPCKIVATGGFAEALAPLTASLKTVIPSLLLQGLARLYGESAARHA